MEFNGFYNFGGGGTETILGVVNENIPSFQENVCANEKMLFTGQFANLSRQLIHITMTGFGSAQAFHRHDLRAYESIQVYNIPLAAVAVHVPPGETIGVHGMGTIWTAQDADEYAIMGAKSGMFEALPNSPQFNTDSYTRISVAAIQTADIIASGTLDDYALYKLTVSADAAQTIDIFWTNAANGNVQFITRIDLAGAGTYSIDFDPAYLRNPNRQGGKLRYTTITAAQTVIDSIGHIVLVGQ
mgnify:CR=1 FL=1|tara:strand:+ start:118 stop:846 length:729 start_codon:yes stop_codon:yes gene_type:complete